MPRSLQRIASRIMPPPRRLSASWLAFMTDLWTVVERFVTLPGIDSCFLSAIIPLCSWTEPGMSERRKTMTIAAEVHPHLALGQSSSPDERGRGS